MGTIRINSGTYGNKSPLSIGDYNLYLPNRIDRVLTVAMFTTDTNPPYQDPENDLPDAIKFITIPTDGVVTFNGVPVTVGQEISITDINTDTLIYNSPDQDTSAQYQFEFAVRDSGSGEYSTSGTFTITSGRKVVIQNYPPNVGDMEITIEYGDIATMNNQFLTSTYIDNEGDPVNQIKITTLPSTGVLLSNGNPVSPGDIVTTLTYESDDNLYQGHSIEFNYQISDTGTNQFSNEGTITINVLEEIKTPPVVDDNSDNLIENTYKFSVSSFINNFSDANGDSYNQVTIKSLPLTGNLFYQGNAVIVGKKFSVQDSINLEFRLGEEYAVYNGVVFKFNDNITEIIRKYNQLGYELLSNENGILFFQDIADPQFTTKIEGAQIDNTELCFNFTTSDDSRYNLISNIAEFCLVPQGDINIKDVYENKPPTVGNIEYTISQDVVLTIPDFDITSTFEDIENDNPLELKIVSLPDMGILTINGNPISAGDIVNITTLEYTPIVNRAAYSVIFKYQLSDDGSEQFSNTGNILINVEKQVTNPPTVDDNSGNLSNDGKYQFTLADVTKNYQDDEGDPFKDLIIVELPGVGELKYNNRSVSIGQVISLNNIGLLSYFLPPEYVVDEGIVYRYDSDLNTIILQYEAAGYYLDDTTGGILTFRKLGATYLTKTVEGEKILNSLSFLFSIVEQSPDNLVSNVAEFTFIPVDDINIEQPYVNQPPNIGDVAYNTLHSQSVEIVMNDILDTYTDIENDAIKELKIISLPAEGTLTTVSGDTINVGDIVPFVNMLYTPSSNIVAYSTNFTYQASDQGSGQFSNIGTATINVAEKVENAPMVDDNSDVLSNKIYTFKETSFTNNFADSDGNGYETVTIRSLPTIIGLQYLGNNINVGDTFPAVNSSGLKFVLNDRYAIYDGTIYDFTDSITNIVNNYDGIGYKLTTNDNGILIFTDPENPDDEITIRGKALSNSDLCFKFTTSDNSALKLNSNVAEFCLAASGNINVKEIYINNPPVVGDNTLYTKYNVTLPLLTNDFIEDTDPRFNDPEGDQPYQLKILSLPDNGVLELNGVPVTINQILDFDTDITRDKNTTLLMYIPDSSRIDITGVVFRFAVSDTGSKIFVE